MLASDQAPPTASQCILLASCQSPFLFADRSHRPTKVNMCNPYTKLAVAAVAAAVLASFFVRRQKCSYRNYWGQQDIHNYRSCT
jgi:hypothetical protein